jgi:hypothetical protein
MLHRATENTLAFVALMRLNVVDGGGLRLFNLSLFRALLSQVYLLFSFACFQMPVVKCPKVQCYLCKKRPKMQT